jgi:hypothetical protein
MCCIYVETSRAEETHQNVDAIRYKRKQEILFIHPLVSSDPKLFMLLSV